MKLKNDNDHQIMEETVQWAGDPMKSEGDAGRLENKYGTEPTINKQAKPEQEGGFLQKLKRHFDSHQDCGPTTLSPLQRSLRDQLHSPYDDGSRDVGNEQRREHNHTMPPKFETLDLHISKYGQVDTSAGPTRYHDAGSESKIRNMS